MAEVNEDVKEDIFTSFPDYVRLQINKNLTEKTDLDNPFFIQSKGVARDTVTIGKQACINFSTYNYLNLNGHPEVSRAAKKAIDEYGTSVSASRIVGGERPIITSLEEELAEFLGVDDSVVFVSGHATNVSTIGYLMHSPESNLLISNANLILYDDLSHNSIVQGAMLSGANMCRYRHNDMEHLEKLLIDNRSKYERTLIISEGLYSMDGDLPPLPKLVELKEKYNAMLMVDEAHSLGVLGKTGKGIAEHFNINPQRIDILMGTLSKSLAGCGGYIAGSHALTELLRHHVPGFVFSVGMPPPMAAASLQALRVMQREPERLKKLQANSQYFLQRAKKAKLNTGYCQGHCIIPIIITNPIEAVRVANRLLKDDIYVQPMIYPAVKRKQSRLRFFISSEHTKEQIDYAVEKIADHLGCVDSH